MGKRGPKVKFSRTRDAGALFSAVRGKLGYRRAMLDVSVLLGVDERNIEREIDPRTTLLPTSCDTSLNALALCAIAANLALIQANLRGQSVVVRDWPEPFKTAICKLLPGN